MDLLYFFCLVFAMPLYTSLYMCLVVTCWERADLFALVGERSGSVVECLIQDRRAVGSSLTGVTALCL